MNTGDQLKRIYRQGTALSIYRALLGLVFLVAAFHAFPEQQTPIALGFLVFSHGIAAIGMGQTVVAAAQNHIADHAERKTRHTILMSPPHDEDLPAFWDAVDYAVTQELAADPDTPYPWWLAIGSVMLKMLGHSAADVTLIVIAFALAG